MTSKYRLREKSVFRRLFTEGGRRELRLLRVIFLKNTLNHARLALVTPRTLDKRSVVRNRLRRRALERIRAKTSILKRSIDFTIIFKKGAGAASRKELYEEISQAVNILNKL